MTKKFTCAQSSFGFWVASSLPEIGGQFDQYNEARICALRHNLQKAIDEDFTQAKMGHADITYRKYYETEIERLSNRL